MSATNRGAKRREKDFYPTPRHVITPLLRHVDFTDALSLEPCRGNGAIYDELPDPRTYDEISDGLDYLAEPYRADICITNPPFSLAPKSLEKSIAECETVIYLLRLSYLESVDRHSFWCRNRLTHLFPIAPRPSFTGDGQSDNSGYAWFVWDGGNRMKPKHWYVPLLCPKPKVIRSDPSKSREMA